MGKNQALDELGSLIANTIVHKILVEKTTKPESINHLEKEENEYRTQSFKRFKVYNWNAQNIEMLKEQIIRKIQNKFNNKYPDIDIINTDLYKLIEEEFDEL